MDRSTFRYLALCYLALAACEQKTAEVVFSDEKTSLSCAGSAISNQYIVHYVDGSMSVERANDRETFKNGFVTENLDRIQLVEPDREFHLNDISGVQADTSVSSQSAVDQWGLDIISAQAAWNQNILGQQVTVAVLDTEVDVHHPQLQSQIAINTGEIPGNGIDDDKNGVVDDYAGVVFISKADNANDPLPDHGTHVAGIIAADPHSGSLSGVAPSAKILPAQFLSRSGSGLLSDALRAMKYLEGRNVQVLNASWGGSPCVKSMRDAMQRLSDQGVVLVVASGNAGQDLDRSPEFPAAFNLANQLTVAASTSLDYMTSWSNNSFNLVHLAAPGDAILSTIANNRIGTMSGTSMATPFVAGAAALLKSAFPKATPAQIKNAIMNSVDIRSGHEFRVQSRGRLNVERALASLRSVAQ